ncbi:hypothetical protein CAEBREN_10061 [Caenorhabditis brenneri]|uniref:Uncharacterized protein n=1 Tax=Caenorhabditis brenneri TaxID=135651 RepID=G0P4G0_CAEBE|nr:hypothetical protein CAEBREN_10061 [Caenorhabditis brenneri]
MIYYPFAREEDDTPRKPQPKVKAEPEDDGYEAQTAPAQPANQAAPALERLVPANDVARGGNRAPQTPANNPNALERATQLELAAVIAMVQMNQGGSLSQSSGRVQVPTAVTSAPHASVHQPPVSSHLAHPMKTPEVAAPEDPAPQQANTLGNLNFGQFGVVQAAPTAPNALLAAAQQPPNSGNLNFGAHGLAAPAAPNALLAPALPPANLGNLNFGIHRFAPPAAPNVPMNAPSPPEFNHFHNFDQNPRFQNQPRLPHHPFPNQAPPQFGGFAVPNAHQMPHPAQQVVMVQQMNHLFGMMMNEDPQTTNLRLRMMNKDQLEHLVRDLLARFKLSEQQRHYTYGELVQRDRVIGRMRNEFNEDTLKKEQEIKKLHEENAKNDIEFVNLSVEAPRLRKANQDLEGQKLKWEDERSKLNDEKLILSQQKYVAEREKNRIQAEKAEEMKNLKDEHTKKLNDVGARHQEEMMQMKAGIQAEKDTEIHNLKQEHAKNLADVEIRHQKEMTQVKAEVQAEETNKIQQLKEHYAKKLAEDEARHQKEMKQMKNKIETEKDAVIRKFEDDHAKKLAAVETRHQKEMKEMKNKIEEAKTNEIQNLKDNHSKTLAEVKASHQEEMEKTKKTMEEDAQLQKKKQEKLLKDNETLQTKINEMKNNGKGLIGLMTTLFTQDDDEPTTSNTMSSTMEKFKEVLMEQTKKEEKASGQKRSSDNATDQVEEKRVKMDDNADLE